MCVQLWDQMFAELPQRTQQIDSLHKSLQQHTRASQAQLAAQLQQLTLTLTEIAHMTEGEVERIVEAEALQANAQQLANQRAFATLVSQLHVAEVHLERSCKRAFDDGVKEWRMARTHHAISCFVQYACSAEVLEPAGRSAKFQSLEAGQQAHFAKLTSKLLDVLQTDSTYQKVSMAQRCGLHGVKCKHSAVCACPEG